METIDNYLMIWSLLMEPIDNYLMIWSLLPEAIGLEEDKENNHAS